jgi:CRISPR/Cas system-associated endonuclease Cas3-HD
MYDVNDILARLQKGETPDDIANECAQVLNAAMELDKKNKEAELQKQKAAEAEKEAKLDKYAKDMADAMLNYFTVLDPEAVELMNDENMFDVKEVRQTLDASYATIKSMLALAGALADKKPITMTPSSSSITSADASIAKFLKSFGL